MIFLLAALVGVLLGYVLGGRISNLPSLRLRAVWLVLSALILQVLIFPLFSERPLLPYATVPLHVISYLLIFVFLLLNLRERGLLAIGVGALLNFAAIAANGGRMPASATALARAGLVETADRLTTSGAHGNVLLMGEGTRLNVLGDWLYFPAAVPFATAFSVGDVVIMIGIAWLIVRGMRAWLET
jgi:hypothetical protein